MGELALTKRLRLKKNQGGGNPLPLRRKYERAYIEQKTREGTDVSTMNERLDKLERKFTEDELRLSQERDARIAREVDAKATSLMNADPTLDYSAATRLALAGDERFTRSEADNDQDQDLASAIKRRMVADPEGYDNEGEETVGSVHDMRDADYEHQVKEAMRERGYEV